MTTRHDDEQWHEGWDISGTRRDDNQDVSLRFGVIGDGKQEWVAIGIAGESPIALDDRTAAEVAQLAQWAVQERELITDSRLQRETDPLKERLNRAILTPGQYRRIRSALERHARQHSATDAALHILRDNAPPGWNDK